MLHELVETGNTVVVIEHNLEVIKTADWIIDLGPEGGDGGGEIVAQGTPEDIVKVARSYTGQFLKPVLGRRGEQAEEGRAAGGGVNTISLVQTGLADYLFLMLLIETEREDGGRGWRKWLRRRACSVMARPTWKRAPRPRRCCSA